VHAARSVIKHIRHIKEIEKKDERREGWSPLSNESIVIGLSMMKTRRRRPSSTLVLYDSF
jgi:hypothetical protein